MSEKQKQMQSEQENILKDHAISDLRRQLEDSNNELNCIATHIDMLVDKTILEEIGADDNGERALQLRVMRIFSFLNYTIKATLEKDKEIERLRNQFEAIYSAYSDTEYDRREETFRLATDFFNELNKPKDVKL